jgi:hypothetical protein
VRRFAITLLAGLALVALGAGSAAAKLSPVEQTWVKPLLKVYDVEAANLSVVEPELRASDALIAASGTNNTRLTDTLAGFVECASVVKKAGPVPSLRLQGFLTDLLDSCSHLSTGAQDIAHAIGQISQGNGVKASTYLKASTPALLAGSKLLAAAQKQLTIIGGKNIFEA